ncbi:hypothetical protein CF15_05800 [Pyrodictium occultum]|uniref:Heme o synthase n=1 Tax=Pyrodictium occultum TaxID=2309 RepID=A0A0V8RW22_PYROC|nr:hypothetical protein CF15_05800 [Pyrodictium occultum]
MLVVVLGYISIAAVTALNMYFDRDIDAAMPRTKDRPLAAGRMNPRSVLAGSSILLAASLVIAALHINVYYSVAILIGFLFDIVAYTILLKRKTPLSIIAGAIAGGAPALGGWAAATGVIDVNGLLLSLLVVAWVPAHIWFLATFYREDYRKANVPMLPVIADPNVTAMGIGFGAIVMGYVVVGLWLNGAIGLASLAYGLLASIHVFSMAVKYSIMSGDEIYAKRAFKVTNMHLGMLYLVMILEKLVLH